MAVRTESRLSARRHRRLTPPRRFCRTFARVWIRAAARGSTTSLIVPFGSRDDSDEAGDCVDAQCLRVDAGVTSPHGTPRSFALLRPASSFYACCSTVWFFPRRLYALIRVAISRRVNTPVCIRTATSRPPAGIHQLLRLLISTIADPRVTTRPVPPVLRESARPASSLGHNTGDSHDESQDLRYFNGNDIATSQPVLDCCRERFFYARNERFASSARAASANLWHLPARRVLPGRRNCEPASCQPSATLTEPA